MVAPPPGTTVDIDDLLTMGVYTSPFQGVIPRPLELVGVPSLFYSPRNGSVYNIKIAPGLNGFTEVPNMVRLVNEAF